MATSTALALGGPLAKKEKTGISVHEINLQRFTGFANFYDQHRPRPPLRFIEIVSEIASKDHFDLVVDLGAGTGLSSKPWIGHSIRTIGIEPNDHMRQLAIEHHPEIVFLPASSYATGLEDSCADVVACSQSFHWMEPVSTLAEVGRILKPQAIFAVLDCSWPVRWDWRAEKHYQLLMERVDQLEHDREFAETRNVQQYPKAKHLESLRRSDVFSYAQTVFFDNVEPCDSERFLGIALSQGHVQDILKSSPEKLENAITDLARACRNSKATTMTVSYTLTYGIRST